MNYARVAFFTLLAALAAVGWYNAERAQEATKEAARYRALAEDANEALRAAQARSRAAARIAAARESTRAAALAAAEAQNRTLQDALQAVPAWSHAPVPDGVRNALDAGNP